MNFNNFEAVILLLLFFLPGYIYSSLKRQFKYQYWESKEIMLATCFFTSIIFQSTSWFLLSSFFKTDILAEVRGKELSSLFLSQNLFLISRQAATSILIASFFAIIISLKQFKRLILWVQKKTNLTKILNLGYDPSPSITSAIEQYTDYGDKVVKCVIETKDNIYYDGNLRHIGFGRNEKDYIFVLSKITKSAKGKRYKFPDEIKILIPYDNINSVSYTEYPMIENITDGNIFPLPPLIIVLIASELFFIFLAQANQNSYVLTTVSELYGAFVVTFLGVYISFAYSKKQERQREIHENEKNYVNSLKLLGSELNIYKITINHLLHALEDMPNKTEDYHGNYCFLIELTKDIRNNVFYSLIASGSISEISKREILFNKIQQAYYNTSMLIDGLHLSKELFVDFKGKDSTLLPEEVKLRLLSIVNQEAQKAKIVLAMIVSAENETIEELKKYGVTFSEEVACEKN